MRLLTKCRFFARSLFFEDLSILKPLPLHRFSGRAARHPDLPWRHLTLRFYPRDPMHMNDSINPIILYEGTLLHLVPHEPDNGYRFYVSFDGTIGLQISPTGVEKLLNATPTTCENCKVKSNANRKQRYLHFAHPWNTNEQILVHRAVYLAWVGSIPKEKRYIDHKNGITTDNRYQNLEPVTDAENNRRTGILKGLREVGINPAELPFSVLDKYLAPPVQSDPTIAAGEERDKYL